MMLKDLAKRAATISSFHGVLMDRLGDELTIPAFRVYQCDKCGNLWRQNGSCRPCKYAEEAMSREDRFAQFSRVHDFQKAGMFGGLWIPPWALESHVSAGVRFAGSVVDGVKVDPESDEALTISRRCIRRHFAGRIKTPGDVERAIFSDAALRNALATADFYSAWLSENF